MKNTLLHTLLYCIVIITVPFVKSFAQAPLTNIDGNANAIVSKLTTPLSLTEDQKPRFLNLVTEFLKQRAPFVPFASTNQKAYDSKINSMHNGFYKKLQHAMSADQYNAFLKLKPAENDPTNVLCQLYY